MKISNINNIHISTDKNLINPKTAERIQQLRKEIENNKLQNKKVSQTIKSRNQKIKDQIEAIEQRQEKINVKINSLRRDKKIKYLPDVNILVAEIYNHATGAKIGQIPIDNFIEMLKKSSVNKLIK